MIALVLADTPQRVPDVVVDSTLFYGGDSSAVVSFMHERTDGAWHDSTSTTRWPR